MIVLFIIGPLGLEVMASTDTQYEQLSSRIEKIWSEVAATINYTYDANGALTDKDVTGGNDPHTVDYVYNLQGRLSIVTTTRVVELDSDGNDDHVIDEVTYVYNSDGVRISKEYKLYHDIDGVSEQDRDLDGDRVFQTGSTETTDYLIDPANHTGYAQVLEETIDDGSQVDRISYTIGDDVLAETISTDIEGTPSLGDAQYLIYDGHGSVRHRADINGSGAYAEPIYDPSGQNITYNTHQYDGYGNSLIPQATDGLGYAGEMWDNDASHYYNRARWYNPANGRFNRVDPFAGFNRDPQSLHKYTYVHNNPINGTDPSGLLQLIDVLSALGIRDIVDTIKSSKELAIKKGVRQSFNELRDAFSMEDQKPLTKVAIAAEMLWVTRMRALGLNVIAMQSSPVGTHGPDLLAFGMIHGELKIIVGEVKGMKSSKILSSFNKLSNGMLQMSSNWIDRHFSQIVNAAAGAIFEAIGGNVPVALQDQVKGALERFNFEYYLLRARRFTGNEWTLRGFRLLHIEGDDDMVVRNREPLDQRIEAPFKTPGPPGF